jgi:hypothetical protein
VHQSSSCIECREEVVCEVRTHSIVLNSVASGATRIKDRQMIIFLSSSRW